MISPGRSHLLAADCGLEQRTYAGPFYPVMSPTPSPHPTPEQVFVASITEVWFSLRRCSMGEQMCEARG